MKLGVRAARGQPTWRSGRCRCVSPPSRPASPRRHLARASATRRRARSVCPSCRASAPRSRSSGGRGHAAGRGSSGVRAAARDTAPTSRRCTAPVPRLAWCRAAHCRWRLCQQATGRADGDASSQQAPSARPEHGGGQTTGPELRGWQATNASRLPPLPVRVDGGKGTCSFRTAPPPRTARPVTFLFWLLSLIHSLASGKQLEQISDLHYYRPRN